MFTFADVLLAGLDDIAEEAHCLAGNAWGEVVYGLYYEVHRAYSVLVGGFLCKGLGIRRTRCMPKEPRAEIIFS